MTQGGRKVLVTGGSSGIGLAIARGFLENGDDVALCYRSRNALSRADVRAVLDRFPHACALQIDLSDSFNPSEVISDSSERLGGEVNVLVNNAAAISRAGFLDTKSDEFRDLMKVNVEAPYALMKAFSSNLIEKSLIGSIVNISSLSSRMARSRMPAYQCTKAALEMLTTSAAVELGPYGIRSNIIAPGLVATPANASQWDLNPEQWKLRAAEIPLGRAGTPNDIVSAALFLSDERSSWVNGAKIVVDGGLSAY